MDTLFQRIRKIWEIPEHIPKSQTFEYIEVKIGGLSGWLLDIKNLIEGERNKKEKRYKNKK